MTPGRRLGRRLRESPNAVPRGIGETAVGAGESGAESESSLQPSGPRALPSIQPSHGPPSARLPRQVPPCALCRALILMHTHSCRDRNPTSIPFGRHAVKVVPDGSQIRPGHARASLA